VRRFIKKECGLETDDYKSIYKLIQIRKGHTTFFNALAEWLHDGNKLLIVKGNHDLENLHEERQELYPPDAGRNVDGIFQSK
jgi:UDP-2,3-diacylglucosamine pyrophosphatase LpxH